MGSEITIFQNQNRTLNEHLSEPRGTMKYMSYDELWRTMKHEKPRRIMNKMALQKPRTEKYNGEPKTMNLPSAFESQRDQRGFQSVQTERGQLLPRRERGQVQMRARVRQRTGRLALMETKFKVIESKCSKQVQGHRKQML